MEDISWLSLYIAIFGSGSLISFFVWLFGRIRQSGTEAILNKAHLEEVNKVKARQAEQDEAIRALDKRMTEIDHNIDIRLTSIETDIMYIREMQMAHNASLQAISGDIKSLLRSGRKE